MFHLLDPTGSTIVAMEPPMKQGRAIGAAQLTSAIYAYFSLRLRYRPRPISATGSMTTDVQSIDAAPKDGTHVLIWDGRV